MENIDIRTKVKKEVGGATILCNNHNTNKVESTKETKGEARR